MSALTFALLALALVGPVPAVLARASWPMRAPRAAVVLWQSIAAAAVLSAFSAGLAVGGRLLVTDEIFRLGWPLWLAHVLIFAATLLIGARLFAAVLQVGIATRRRRAHHRMLVDLLGDSHCGASGLRVLRVSEPLAYCLPGVRSRVVLSEGTLSALSDPELQAILSHERAHLRARHDLVLEAFVAVHTAFPRFVRSGSALCAVSLLEASLRAASVLAAFLVLPLLVGQAEHKVMAHMQGRLGPMYAGGFHGGAQLVADGVKFVQKEDITPRAADRWVFRLAPAVALIPYLLAMATIPIHPGVAAVDVPGSLVLVLAATSVGALGTLMAGWASANKYALLGGLRAAAQLVSYELPIVLALASIAMAGGSLSLMALTQAWSPWWLLWQLPGGLAFLVAACAELQRPPFDMPVADAELVMGAWTEYTGLRFAFFLLAEYAGIVVMSLLFAVLWLGGWHGPFEDTLGWLWTLLKGFGVAVLVIWVRAARPRLREDQLQRLAWLWLVPIALAQLLLTGAGVVMGW